MELSSFPYVQLLHPKVIHFPIALFIGAMGMEVLSLIFKKTISIGQRYICIFSQPL